MKTKHLNMVLSFSILSGTMPIYNNFHFLNKKHETVVALESVHEASRIGHAKELLGSKEYTLSEASQIESPLQLNRRIYAEIQQALPARYKSRARQITQTLIKESAFYKMDPVFVMAIIKTESLFNPLALGGYGEIGLMQLKPDTAEWIAKKFDLPYEGPETLKNPQANIRIGLAYMNLLRNSFSKKAVSYVSAYNMGPLNVRRLLAQNIKPQEYSSKVMTNYSKIYSRLANERSEILVAVH